MSIVARLREWLDAPRFCPDDGEAIAVRSIPHFDPLTGAESARWYWSCPEVSVAVSGGSVQWTQWGKHQVHAHGIGRPRWHGQLPEPVDGRTGPEVYENAERQPATQEDIR